MAIFAGNLSSMIRFQLSPKLISIPWAKRVGYVRYCTRDCQSSGPTRYIPKNPNSSSSKILKRAEVEKLVLSGKLFPQRKCLGSESDYETGKNPSDQSLIRNSPKANLEEWSNSDFGEVDDELEFLSENETCEMDAKWTNDVKQEAENVAIRALGTRAFTAAELQKKLKGKGFAPKVIDEVIDGLRSGGFINDYLYAETFSQSRWSSSTWGPKRIKQALHNKGVSKADAEKATKHVFENNESSDDHESSLGLSKLSMDHLFIKASKQWLRGQDVPHDKRKARIVRWLQYRGFDWGVTSFILKKLESQYPS